MYICKTKEVISGQSFTINKRSENLYLFLYLWFLKFKNKKTIMITIIILIILLILFIGIVYIYNKLVRNRNNMEEAWSIIDVLLKKRHDLVPTLVEIVKGYSFYEKKVLEEITAYRSEAIDAKGISSQVKPENELGKALNNLMVTAEAYPELKASEHFLNLQKQLSELETELERSRRYYNGTVRINNTYQESFPSNIIAGISGFQKGIFFNLDTSAKATPDINL